jgi:hypothetical protein
MNAFIIILFLQKPYNHFRTHTVMSNISLIRSGKIDRAILIIRGNKVMLDSDLASIYEVKTSRLNEQVKRNSERFPNDFMFQLTEQEKQEVIANCDHLEKLKFSRTNPYAFTEHGALMLASVLNTPMAINMSVLIIRAFVKLRELLTSNKELEQKITELESKYDEQFQLVFTAIKQLMQHESATKERAKIGYKIRNANKK